MSVVGLAVAAAIALSGCSSAGGGGGGELKWEDSPISKYTSALWGEVDQAAMDAQQAEIEKLVAACMKDEGFEYTPNTNNGGMMISSGTDMEERDTEEWVASNGYGMVQTQEEMEAQQGEAEEYVDPNQDYLATLSETEVSAFYETLHGPGPTEEEMAAMEEGEGYEYNWETSGCYGAAQHETQGEGQEAYSDPDYKALFDKMNTVYTSAQTDPKIKELDRSWASCMADAGFADFKAKQDSFTLISDAQNAIYESMEYDPETGQPIGDSKDAFAELKQQEIDVALADFRCSKKLNYAQESMKVQFALETQFVEDNKAELDAMLAEYATKK
ncbi:hypothetical protein AWU67_03610 [Microterricola viridarii]|uniref:Uncharacterized protein n=1 Tax=Microterricola viridarii TaxID=412690 RepID=A0A109QWI9_9MICO|nr:hypothetical protein AWU67_03610 [Microterricola viridarii]